ncbi:hypothetical protein MC885_017887 [Smutsia gigantea]|nr:hypothetical protein MC885_017887 [Smutsia gigantea]
MSQVLALPLQCWCGPDTCPGAELGMQLPGSQSSTMLCPVQGPQCLEPGKSSCRATLGGASQTENHKALILQLSPSENCTWIVESPENKSIRIIFSYFQLDPDGSCGSENIKVFDGNSTKGSLLGRVCSANDYVPVFESSSNTLAVQIVTDSARIQRTIPNCGGYLDTLEGSFTSPNYPRPHPELAYCRSYSRSLEVDEHCRFDFVAVYDGPSTTSGLLGQVCGRVRPTFESSSDSLTVVLSTDYANSYRGFSASYTSIYAENVNTSRMRAIISESYLASVKYSENSLQLNDPTCRPRISNVVEFSIPLDGCGTIKKVEDHSITYTNVITLLASPTSELITRQKHLQIIMKCEMEHNSTVEMMYITADDIIQNQNALGKYNTSMALFESSAFEKPILESPYYVDLNQTLYVQVSLYTSDPNLVVFLDTCTASPTSDFASPTYDLIRSGCIQDETCDVYPLSEHYGRFQFNAFKFLKSLGSVYLQCKVLICDSSDHQSRCSHGCVSRGKRDISSYKWKTDSVIGPIRLKRDRSTSGSSGFQYQIHGEETQNQPFNSLHLFSFMVLVLNVVIAATVIVRHFVNQRTDYKYQKLKACSEEVQPQAFRVSCNTLRIRETD